MIQHLQETCGLPSIRDNATVLHEDNATFITQIKGEVIQYLVIKALPSTTLKKLRYDIGMRRLRDLPFGKLKKS